VGFYDVLQAVTTHCFPSLLLIPPPQFKLVLDSIIWAFKHTMRCVADTGLHIMYNLLLNIQQQPNEVAQCFYQTYFLDILQHLFSVLTDSSHTASLNMHAQLLSYLFTIVEMGKVTIELRSGEGNDNNKTVVQTYTLQLLHNAFPHLSEPQLKVTVQGLFSLNQDVNAFKEHLRDFLVQIREVTGEDDSDLFLEERENALKQIEIEKRTRQLAVPGILNPYQNNSVGAGDMEDY